MHEPEQDTHEPSPEADTPTVVIDTNVFVAAGFNPHSSAAAILAAVRSGRLRMAWAPGTRRETRRILEVIPPLDWEDFEAMFADGNAWDADLNPAPFAAVPDAADRYFAALAEAVDGALITNDDDLLGVREQLPVRVFTPSEFAAEHDLS